MYTCIVSYVCMHMRRIVQSVQYRKGPKVADSLVVKCSHQYRKRYANWELERIHGQLVTGQSECGGIALFIPGRYSNSSLVTQYSYSTRVYLGNDKRLHPRVCPGPLELTAAPFRTCLPCVYNDLPPRRWTQRCNLPLTLGPS